MRFKGFSLVGVLVAMMLLSTVVMFILRFNHRVETSMYQPLETANHLRFEAWSYAEGRLPLTPVGRLERRQIDGVPCYLLEADGQTLVLIPP